MKWKTDKPTVEGWYLWRRNNRAGDSLHWSAYFIEEDTRDCWEGGQCVAMPPGGQWAGPLEEPFE